MNTELDAKAEAICNLRGLDPNDDAVWESIKEEIIRDNM